MKEAVIKSKSKNRGTYIVEWSWGHAVFGDMKRARAFADGFNTAWEYAAALSNLPTSETPTP